MRGDDGRDALEVPQFTTSSSTEAAVIGSRPVVGSSKRISSGLAAIARDPTRRCPPEISDACAGVVGEANKGQDFVHTPPDLPVAGRSSYRRYPTFSLTVRESKSAFS